MFLPNGSYVQAVTSDPEKEAGASYGLTIWDELWGYKLPRERLLFDELRPIGTRINSMRLIVSYAGFTDSSDLLLSIYSYIFRDTEYEPNEDGILQLASGVLPDGTTWAARPVPELQDITTHILPEAPEREIPACYEVPELGLFYYNDHEQRDGLGQQGEAGEALNREDTTRRDGNEYLPAYL